jgi:adenosylcobinamide-phosphate synthase
LLGALAWLPPPPGEGWGEGTTALIAAATLCFALLIDRYLGEPPFRLHPVVWMGNYLGWLGKRIAPSAGDSKSPDIPRFTAGALAWCLGAAMSFTAACAITAFAHRLPAWIAVPLLALALKPMLAWRMLHDEVLAVESALAQSLDAGRARLSRLVSRDVSRLSEGEVRESAIESLAENLNDSLVAPIFWFVLLGLPGAAVYRFANTADAMWGYRGEREGRDWEWAGKWAARADDALSWIPARLTAALLLLVSPSLPLRWRAGVGATPRAIRQQSQLTPSPNSGWPMAAMALLLNIRLAKPGVYTLNPAGREPSAADTRRAIVLATRAVFAVAACACIAILGIAAFQCRP